MTATDIAAVCYVYISSAQRQSWLITLQFCLLSLSVGGEASTSTALSSQPWSGSSQQWGRRGPLGDCFKDAYRSGLSKGKNAVWSCWCKGIVKNCVFFVYSCVEQVPLFSRWRVLSLFPRKRTATEVCSNAGPTSSASISVSPFSLTVEKDILCWSCLFCPVTNWLTLHPNEPQRHHERLISSAFARSQCSVSQH